MKICLYLEFYHFLGGRLYRNIGTGLLSSYDNQKKILADLHIPYSETWDDSCDILQINTPWLNSVRIARKAKRLGKKVIMWAHVTAEDTQQVFRFTSFIFWLIKKYLTYAYGLADVVCCPSEYTKSLLVAYGLPKEKLIVQSNGVDTTRFVKDAKKRLRAREQRKLHGVVIGTVGLAIPRKGIDDFLEVARAFPEQQFIWYGKIYSSLFVKPFPKQLPKNVEFTGYVDDIVAAFHSLDVFVFLSFEENQGMAILEAAAAGLPIVVRDIPVYQGWLIHGENCFKAKTVEEIQAGVHRLIHNSDLRERLGRNAKQLAEEHSLQTIKKHLCAVYNVF